MPLSDDYRLIALDESRRSDALRLDTWAFPSAIAVEDLVNDPQSIPLERMYAVVPAGAPDSGSLAGNYGVHTLRAYPVPGAEVACGWLTWVAVHPGHRRRGILSGMIEHHLADCAAQGEAISGLMAAEPAIYGRFGYGMASTRLNLTIPRRAPLRAVPGSDALDVVLEDWDAARHGDLVASLHRGYAALPAGLGRPGWTTWETDTLRTARYDDTPRYREGSEPRRIAIVRSGGEARGYATFHRTFSWERGGPDGTVRVREAVALDAAAAHRLWSVLLDLDLTSRIRVVGLPVDDPITSLLIDLRRTEAEYLDGSWIRIVDLPAALSQRRYAGAFDTVVEVRDTLIPRNAGRWRIRAEAWGHASAERTDADPALALDVRELGAAYLGSTSLAALAQAGLVDVHAPAALGPVAAGFSWPIAAGANWDL